MASVLSRAENDPFRDLALANRHEAGSDDGTPGSACKRDQRTASGVDEVRGEVRRIARVLVVDDDEGVRRQLRYLLEDEGYTVEVAATGSGALTALEDDGFDVVILDVRLPDVSGIEVFEAFRRRANAAKTIIVSGYLVDEEIARAEHRGAHFLAKPVDSDRLLKLLQSLERARGDTP